MSLAYKLKKWSEQQLISGAQAEAILAFEKNKSRSLLYFGLGGIGVLSIILGFASVVAANWDLIPPEAKITIHALLNLALGFILVKFFDKPSWVREVLVTLLAGLVLTFIALVGQILQTQAPLWQPLGIWLLLATPMLLIYARFFGVVAAWLGILGVFSVSLATQALSEQQAEVFLIALPFLLYILFSFKKVRDVLPNWTSSIQAIFWVCVVGLTTVFQSLWRMGNGHDEVFASIATAGIGVLTIFLLNFAQRKKMIAGWQNEKPEWDAVLLVSFVFAALPVLVAHGRMELLGAVMFCLYWLFLGGVGLRLGIDRLWSAAVILVGIRLFIAYVDIMGSLALQGIGFFLTGGLFLGMAWGARKIIHNKPAWLIASTQEGAQR